MSLSIVMLPGSADGEAVTVRSFLAVAEADSEMVVTGVVPDGIDDERVRSIAEPGLKPVLGQAATSSRGGWVALVGAGDQFEPGALAAISCYLAEIDADVVYTDHRYVRPEDGPPLQKPRWLPRLLEQTNYLARLVAVRRDIAIRALSEPWQGEWDYLLRATEQAHRVGHIPVVAVALAAPIAIESIDAARGVVQRHLARSGSPARVVANADGSLRVRGVVPKGHVVSIIVPTGGARRKVRGQEVVLVENLLRSLLTRTRYPHWEVVVVASAGTDPAVLDRCREADPSRVRVLHVDGAFNFSSSVNAGAHAARGSSLLLLNDDTEVVSREWLGDMVSVLARPSTGAVGAKLLFPDGTVQHIGVVCPPNQLPMHPRIFEPDSTSWDMTLDVDYLAVTGACLLTDRELFLRVGGLSEALPLNFNDVDYCLRLAELGLTNTCVNSSVLVHFESSTRPARILDSERTAYFSWEPVTIADPHVAYWN